MSSGKQAGRKAGKRAGAVACESIGLGTLAFAWASLARPSSLLSVAFGADACEALSLALRAGALLAAACVAMLCLKDPYRGAPLSRRSARLFLASAIVSEVLGAAALVVLAWWDMGSGSLGAGASAGGGLGTGPAVSTASVALTGVAGLAATVLTLLWLDELSGDGSGPSPRTVAGALAVFGLLSPLSLTLPANAASEAALWVCCTAASLLVLLAHAKSADGAGAAVVTGAAQTDGPAGGAAAVAAATTTVRAPSPCAVPQPPASPSSPADDGGVATRLATLGRTSWWALAVALIGFFLFGFTWNPLRSGMPPSERCVLVVQQTVGALAASALILGVSRAAEDRLLDRLRRTVVPILVATFVITPYFSVDAFGDTWYSFVGCVRECSTFTFIAALVLCLPVATRVSDASGFLSAALAILLAQASACLGVAVSSAFGGAVSMLPVILFVLYLISTLVAGGRERESSQKSRALEEGVFDDYLQARCTELSENQGLSPREFEVLLRLARGHGYTYIAEEMFLSESTVRTHSKAIFKKLGISSREELIDEIDNRHA